MPCTFKYQDSCHVYRTYIGNKGNSIYNGELCRGCLWWQSEKGGDDLLSKKVIRQENPKVKEFLNGLQKKDTQENVP